MAFKRLKFWDGDKPSSGEDGRATQNPTKTVFASKRAQPIDIHETTLEKRDDIRQPN